MAPGLYSDIGKKTRGTPPSRSRPRSRVRRSNASWDAEAAVAAFRRARGALGPWAAPAYVAAHALTLALCPPDVIFFEGGTALVFGFLPGVACVFSAKVLSASLSFWIGRHKV